MSSEYEDAVREHSEMIYRLALAGTGNVHDAEDVTQDVFLKLLNSKKAFSDDEHRKAWLIKVTVNQVKLLRRSAWFRKRNRDEIPEIADGDDLCTDTENKIVYEAVMSLKKEMRLTVILYYYYDYPCGEIAKMTGTKEATVRTRLRRAKEQLSILLKEDFCDE
ncbi:MAG: RNA polymerase sigma factor [Huintestinicola sp.]